MLPKCQKRGGHERGCQLASVTLLWLHETLKTWHFVMECRWTANQWHTSSGIQSYLSEDNRAAHQILMQTSFCREGFDNHLGVSTSSAFSSISSRCWSQWYSRCIRMCLPGEFNKQRHLHRKFLGRPKGMLPTLRMWRVCPDTFVEFVKIH